MTLPNLHLDHSVLCLSLLLTGTCEKGSQLRVSAYPRLSRHGLEKPFRSGECLTEAGLVGGWLGQGVRETPTECETSFSFTDVFVKIRQIYFDHIEKLFWFQNLTLGSN